jgi:outer membrane protein OmpA-like peptidoglycan-associated protein
MKAGPVLAAMIAVAFPASAAEQSVDQLIEALSRNRPAEGNMKFRNLSIHQVEERPVAPTPTVQPQPTTAPAPVALPAQPTVMLDVKFDNNSDRIRPEAAELLGRLGTALSSDRLRSDRFRVVGHTSSTGRAAANQILSERRAAAVRRFLDERYPAVRDRLVSEGRGSTSPLTADATDGANRRVEVTNITESGARP